MGPRFFLPVMDQALTELTAEIRQRVADLGYEVVDLRRQGAGSRVRLQIRVDRVNAEPGQGITVDECAAVSRALQSWLDEAQLLGPRYVLEVSSPGIERPVRWREHWERYRGREVSVRIEGRGRLRAVIQDVRPDADVVVLRPTDGGDAEDVPLERVREATLVVDWEAIERSATERTSTKSTKESG
ncbi:MAG: ribosome maturation factor RimP [Gemmatimonadota bacterium]|nr:ribosome maturation factor RimP [Gemmatimonadota bacterium]